MVKLTSTEAGTSMLEVLVIPARNIGWVGINICINVISDEMQIRDFW